MLKKGAFCTDIHFGKKSNSPIHNQDCLNYLDWFCDQVKKDKTIDYIGFLGDWNESRTAIDISTINYSYLGAKKLNDLGLPVYFVVGNHDMGSRHARDIYSTIPFNEFKNFIVINEPMVISNMLGGALFVPFLTKDEYPTLSQHTDKQLWAGHFEFKGFVLTGYGMKLEHGPDAEDFKDVGTILSGHFHRRQISGNTHYIGNCFPMDFGDSNDINRGLAVYDHTDNSTRYINWPSCPRYMKVKLTELLDDAVQLADDCYVEVDVDTAVTYQELSQIEFAFNDKHNLRSFKLDESSKFIQDNNHVVDDIDIEGETTDQLIVNMLQDVDADKFDRDLLVEIYRKA